MYNRQIKNTQDIIFNVQKHLKRFNETMQLKILVQNQVIGRRELFTQTDL